MGHRPRRSLTHHRPRAEELGRCTGPGFAGCRSPLAGRTLYCACSLGPTMGSHGGGTANRATPRPYSGPARSRARRYDYVERLGASCGCADCLCCRCRHRWPIAPAVHHEENRQGAHLGLYLRAYRTRNTVALLGSCCRRTVARRTVRVQSAMPKEILTLETEI